MEPPMLHIEDPEAVELANGIAERTGRPVSTVVVEALRRKNERVGARTARRDIDTKAIRNVLSHAHSLPDLTTMTTQEIFDDLYDENGLFKW